MMMEVVVVPTGNAGRVTLHLDHHQHSDFYRPYALPVTQLQRE